MLESYIGHLKRAVLHQRLIEAVQTNNLALLKKCLESGANPNYLSLEHGICSMHIAAETGDVNLARCILKWSKSADINCKSDHQRTPLFIACMRNRVMMARFLLDIGANPNMADSAGRTPLHISVRFNAVKILQMLLNYKVNVNALDDFMETPLSLALVDHRNITIAKILLAHGVDFRVEAKRTLHVFFECVLQCKNVEETKYVVLLLDNGIDINIKDATTKRTCLHFVAITGCLSLAIILVERGAFRYFHDVTGRTPAMIAKDYGNEFVWDYLVKGYRPPNVLLLLKYVKRWKERNAPVETSIIEPELDTELSDMGEEIESVMEEDEDDEIEEIEDIAEMDLDALIQEKDEEKVKLNVEYQYHDRRPKGPK